jgi:hypothetical protein
MESIGITIPRGRHLSCALSAARSVSLAVLMGCATTSAVRGAEMREAGEAEALPAPGLASTVGALSSCMSVGSQERDPNLAIREARELIRRKSYSEAEDLILAAVRSLDPTRVPRLPAVESGTLYVYGEPPANRMPAATDWAVPTVPASRPGSDAAGLLAGLRPRVRELFAATPWKRVCYVYPAVPDLYRCLGLLALERGDCEEAIGWLDTSIAWWPDGEPARALKVDALTRLRRYPEARQAALAALEDCVLTAAERALLERSLGSIAIEELALDEAEMRFLTSLSLEPQNRLALEELAFIDEVRSYGCIDRQGRYFHAASGIRLPRKAGRLERLRIAYADPTDVEVDYEGLLAPGTLRRPVSATLRLVSASWARETACAALLDSIRSGTPGIAVALDWRRRPEAAPAPGVEVWHLTAVSPRKAELVQLWLVQREAWTVICEVRYSPVAGLRGQDVLALQASLEGLVRSIEFPAA